MSDRLRSPATSFGLDDPMTPSGWYLIDADRLPFTHSTPNVMVKVLHYTNEKSVEKVSWFHKVIRKLGAYEPPVKEERHYVMQDVMGYLGGDSWRRFYSYDHWSAWEKI